MAVKKLVIEVTRNADGFVFLKIKQNGKLVYKDETINAFPVSIDAAVADFVIREIKFGCLLYAQGISKRDDGSNPDFGRYWLYI